MSYETEISTNIVKGKTASNGIAFGTTFFVSKGHQKIIQKIEESDIESEILRLEKLLRNLSSEFTKISNSFNGSKNSLGEIYETHSMILEDADLFNKIKSNIEKCFSAPFSTQKIFNQNIELLKSSDNVLLRERAADFEDLKNLILDRITEKDEIDVPENSIIVTKQISPKDMYNYLQKGVLGFATEKGGVTSHVAIIARSFNIPFIYGIPDITKSCSGNKEAIIDGNQAQIIFNPNEIDKVFYQNQLKELESKQVKMFEIKDLSTQTLDKKQIKLKANLDHIEEIYDQKFAGHDGIGLLRTESVISAKHIFDEKEQLAIYEKVAEEVFPKKVTIRLFDYGSDKPPEGFIIREENPALGLRGIRFLLANPGILDTQLQAILRASKRKNLEIMIPMVSNVSEVEEVKRRIDLNKEILKETGEIFDDEIKLGIMIEVPSIAYKMDKLAKLVDFYSVGTNDLMQYFFAADRTNDNVSELQNFEDQSFYKFLSEIITKSKKQNIPISICGELAQSFNSLNYLLGIGVDSISIPITKILEVKNHIRNSSLRNLKKSTSTFLKS
jgi:phosphotransferase system enzyme I (PtsI)